MLGVAAGIQASVHALRAVDPQIVAYHVDATDLFETEEPQFEAEARHRQQLVYLALDLVSGRVIEGHPLQGWLSRLVEQAELERLREKPTPPDVIGLNLYPLFSRKRLTLGRDGWMRIKMKYTEHGLIARGYYDVFGYPTMISEAATSALSAKRLDTKTRRRSSCVGKLDAEQ
jgi:beta-glucosidase